MTKNITSIKEDKHIALVSAITGIILYIPSSTLLYVIGYFSQIIAYLLFLSIAGLFFIYKKPKIARSLFLINVVGVFLTLLFYILTTEQNWYNIATFIIVVLVSANLFILLSAYVLNKILKQNKNTA